MALNPSSIRFNGTTQLVKLDPRASIRNMGSFTCMTWFKPDVTMNDPLKKMWVERQGSGSKVRFSMTPYAGKLRCEFSPKDGVTDTNYDAAFPQWSDERWHHGAFSASLGGANPTYKIIIDGQKVAEGKLVLPAGVTTVDNTAPLGVYLGNASFHTSGSETFSTDRFWRGKLDDVLIFNTAISESAILAYVQSHDFWDANDASIFSNYRFHENTGSTAADDDNAGWTATLYTWNSGTQTLTPTTNMWTKDRPFLGNVTADTTAPTAPTSPTTGTITSDGFTFGFTANRINDDNIWVYQWEIQLSLVNTFSSVVRTDYLKQETGPFSFTFTGLLPNTNYYVRARAVDEAGNTSAWTSTSTVLTSTQGDVTPPNPPTALVASSITHNSFALGFTDAADHAGYKLDVSRTNTFSTFIDTYQNKNIGDVTSTTVVSLSPLTNYYVRMRTYDAAGNESVNSVVLVVQTAPPPDIAPPTQVILEEATSIASSAWTMNWQASTDDVAVVSYEIDVAKDVGFTVPLMFGSTPVMGYDVGNVLSYRVVGAESETTYYTRVRAKDASGKESVNSEVVLLTTLALSVEDGGLLTADLLPSHAYRVWSASPSTKSTTLTVSGAAGAATSEVYLRFDLTSLTGVVASALLSFEATGSIGTGFTISATGVANNVFDMETITWSTRPTVGGTVFAADAFASVNIDLSGSLSSRNVFIVKLTSTETGSITLTNPQLTVDTDPISATQTADVTTSTRSGTITNYHKNPSFEAATATEGWLALAAGAVIAGITNPAMSAAGSKYCYVTASGAGANQGITLNSTHYVAAVKDEYWTFSAGIRWSSGSKNLTMRIQELSAANAVLETTTQAIVLPASNGFQRFSLTRLFTNASTAKLNIAIYTTGTTVAAFDVDTVQIEKSSHMNAYVDGTMPGSFWNGTANASTSSMIVGARTVVSSYIGDNNTDNAALFTVRPPLNSEIFSTAAWTAVSVNRLTKQWSTAFGPSYGAYNLIVNPSFEEGINFWSNMGGATLAHDTSNAARGGASLKVTAAGANQGATSDAIAIGASVPIHARVRVFAPLGMTVGIKVNYFNSAGAANGDSGYTSIVSDGTWLSLSKLATTPASTVSMTLSVYTTDVSPAAPLYVDEVQITKSTIESAYMDGSLFGAVWDGTPNRSTTSVVVLPQQTYDLRWTYTDPDGVVGVTGNQPFTHGLSYTIPAIPDNATTITNVTYTPGYTQIDARVFYSGDDDNDMTAMVSYKRADLSTWTLVAPMIHRTNKTVHAKIEALQPGTSYTIQIVLTDTDGVFNPTSGVVQQNVSTLSTFGVVEGTASIQFNGMELMGGAGGHIGVIEHNSFDFPNRRLDIKDQPRRHGSVKVSDYWGSKEIQLRGFVAGETRGELAQHVDLLKRTFAASSGLLTIDTLTNQQRYYHATCEKFEAPENAEEHFRHLEWEATFVCADPFAYARNTTRVTNDAVTNGATVTLNNEGDIDAELQLTIFTNHSYPLYLTIINDTTGEMLRPSSFIIAGDRLLLDSGSFSVSKNGLESIYTGSFIHLAPGENTLRVLLTSDYTAVTPAINLVSVWQSRYI